VWIVSTRSDPLELGFVGDDVQVVAQACEFENAADLWRASDDEQPVAASAQTAVGGEDGVESRRGTTSHGAHRTDRNVGMRSALLQGSHVCDGLPASFDTCFSSISVPFHGCLGCLRRRSAVGRIAIG